MMSSGARIICYSVRKAHDHVRAYHPQPRTCRRCLAMPIIEQTLAELARRIEQLEHRAGVLEDIHAIRRVQHAYGYYLDKCLYDEVVDLFSETGEVSFMG